MGYTQDTYITKAKQVHNNKYTYTNSVYKGIKNSISIICPVHGEFSQRADHHIQGHGCTKCKYELVKTKLSHKDKFVSKAKTIHGNTYTYKDSEYVNARKPITITCKLHGEFKQAPSAHLRGQGCPKCGIIRHDYTNHSGWSTSEWENAGLSSSNFEGFSLYIIKCKSDTEEFIKVGKTYVNINVRFGYSSNMPYTYSLIAQFFGSASLISELENKVHNVYKLYQYLPLLPFNGYTECFDIFALNDIKTYITTELS